MISELNIALCAVPYCRIAVLQRLCFAFCRKTMPRGVSFRGFDAPEMTACAAQNAARQAKGKTFAYVAGGIFAADKIGGSLLNSPRPDGARNIKKVCGAPRLPQTLRIF